MLTKTARGTARFLGQAEGTDVMAEAANYDQAIIESNNKVLADLQKQTAEMQKRNKPAVLPLVAPPPVKVPLAPGNQRAGGP